MARLSLLLPTLIVEKHRVPALRLRSTLLDAIGEGARFGGARVRGRLGGVGAAGDFEGFAVGVVGFAVLRGTYCWLRCWGCGCGARAGRAG